MLCPTYRVNSFAWASNELFQFEDTRDWLINHHNAYLEFIAHMLTNKGRNIIQSKLVLRGHTLDKEKVVF